MVAFLLFAVLIVIVALAIVFARMSVLSTRIADMEKRLLTALGLVGELEKTIRESGRKAAVTRKEPGRGLRKRMPPLRQRVDGGSHVPAPSQAQVQGPLTPPVSAAKATPPPVNSRTKEEWEAMIGGKLLNRIGALALILGVGFFLQYAFANDWITEPVRVVIGILLGLTLLAGAARSASGGYQIFAQGLVGAGIAILYLSAYASFNYYHLLSQPLAFVFMSAVTVITFTQAFRYNSIIVALLGWLGGFLTPFLLSTGEVNPVGLFTYLALLNLGLLVVAWRKDSWMSIEPLSMAGTYLIYALWLGEDYAGQYFLPGLLFLALFWIMFHAVHVARVARHVTSYPRFRLTLASLHGFVVYVLLYALMNVDHPEWRVTATLVLAILYGGTSLAAHRRPGEESVFLHAALTAIVLVVIATGIQFKGMELVRYWSVEALALTWAGARGRFRLVRAGGLALYVLGFLLLVGTRGALLFPATETFTLLFNDRAVTFVLLAACLALSGVLIGRIEESGRGTVSMSLHLAWCWVLFILISAESMDFFAQRIRSAGPLHAQHLEFLRTMALPVIWGAYALPLILVGTRCGLRPVVRSGLIMLLIAGCVALVRGLAFMPIGDFVPILNERVVLLALLVAQYAVAWRVLAAGQDGTAVSRRLRSGLQAGIALLFLVLITGETWDYFARGIYRLTLAAGPTNTGEEMARLQNLRQLLLSAGWLVYSIILMGLGIWKRARTVRIEAIVLFGVSILKIFIYDLSFLDTLYRTFSFVGLGVILLAVSYLYQRYRGIILGSGEAGEPART
jgi:uncharacterized membrane protein